MENTNKNNQAEQLEHLVNELEAMSDKEKTSQKPFSGSEHVRKVDILNLPPRKEVHQKKGWIKVKFSRPFVRFLLVCVLFIMIIFGTYYYWGDDILDIIKQL